MESAKGKKSNPLEKQLQQLKEQLNSENAALSKILKLVSPKEPKPESGNAGKETISEHPEEKPVR
ncbi:MAG: hypothetical protein JNL22_15835 [Bacteroidales bacterium]|jgi:hypothetical protein|nr:hypothetical protein [Bacteroidales bacterium]